MRIVYESSIVGVWLEEEQRLKDENDNRDTRSMKLYLHDCMISHYVCFSDSLVYRFSLSPTELESGDTAMTIYNCL
jgi:hypothetical protein